MSRDLLPAVNGTDGRLIWELVAEIKPRADILAAYQMTIADLRTKMRDASFLAAFRETRRLWKSDMNAEKRIEVKARLLVEDSLLEIYRTIHDKETAAPARVAAFEQLTKVAKIGPRKDEQGSGERVKITINVPGVDIPVTVEAERALEQPHE